MGTLPKGGYHLQGIAEGAMPAIPDPDYDHLTPEEKGARDAETFGRQRLASAEELAQQVSDEELDAFLKYERFVSVNVRDRLSLPRPATLPSLRTSSPTVDSRRI